MYIINHSSRYVGYYVGEYMTRWGMLPQGGFLGALGIQGL